MSSPDPTTAQTPAPPRWWWRAAFAVALVLHLGILYAPRAASPPGDVPWDKITHVLIFALVAVTGVLAGVRPVLLGARLLAHAALSELIQWRLLTERSGDVRDAVADVAGVVLGLALTRWPRAAAAWRDGAQPPEWTA